MARFKSVFNGVFSSVVGSPFGDSSAPPPAVTDRLYFTGSEYIEMPGMQFLGANFVITGTLSFDSDSIGSSVQILSDTTGDNGLYKDSSDNLVVTYDDIGGTPRSVTLTALTCVANTEYTFIITSTGAGVTIEVGAQSNSAAFKLDPAEFVLTHWCVNSDESTGFFEGYIKGDWSFTDSSGLQDKTLLHANGSDIFLTMSNIVLDDYEVEFEFIYDSSINVRPTGNSLGPTGRIVIVSSDGSIRYSDANGAGIMNSPGFSDGQHYKARVVIDGTSAEIFVDGVSVASGTLSTSSIAISRIHQQGNFYGGSVVGGMTITNTVSGDTYIYEMDNIVDGGGGSASAANTGNTAPSFNATISNFSSVDDLLTIPINSRMYDIVTGSSTVVDSLGGDNASVE